MSQSPPTSVWRMRLVATSLALAALTFVSQPGRIVGDTKADLVLAPDAFLQRAVHLWDRAGSFGHLQDQAYGYLFPMGPFFWAGHHASIDPWIIQRLWWSLVLTVAFLGVVKLCGALELGTPAARILGGIAFALSPRILSVIGASSIEVWPSALAPWVLVPLVIGLRRGNPRFHAALSAIAVACVGGVNAAATFTVIPLGAIWLLMAQPGARRRSLMIWWPAFVGLGTLWWLGPLVLLGRYSPPFLDFIESATTTTFGATAFDALRGTTNWIPYLDGTQVAGNSLLTNSTIIVNSTVILVLGVWGIARRDNPVGRFLIAALAVGLVLVTLGHSGTNVGTGTFQSLLDGVLAPIRNTHKFDPLIRLPMVLGLVHLVGSLSRGTVGSAAGAARSTRSTRSTIGVVVLAGAALLGSTVPAWTGDLANKGSYTEVPGYWTDATGWLNAKAVDQNSLLLPASPFGTYLWGNPRDEVVQSYLRGPWSVRSAVPLTPPGSIRTLDAYETAFASGLGSRALHDSLVRSGIRYLVVRHDLAGDANTDPELVDSTVRSTPGLTLAKTFGPMIGNPATQTTDKGQLVFVNAGRQTEHRAIEVFAVDRVDSARATVQPLATTPVVIGSPDALLLQDGLFGAMTDVRLATDHGTKAPAGPVVLTDTDRRQEVAFGRSSDNRSASLGRTDNYRIDRPVHDYVRPGDERWKTVPELIGAKRITASSSASDVTEPTIEQSHQPWAAFDGAADTKWVSGIKGTRAWIEIEFTRRVSVDGLTVRLSRGQPARRLVATTDAGSATTRARPGTTTEVETPVGRTNMLRITGPSTGLDPLSLDEVSIPRVRLSRPLRLPSVPASWSAPSDILLSAPGGPAVCKAIGKVTRCASGHDGLGEDGRVIDRIVDLPSPATYATGVSVLPQQSDDLTDELGGDTTLRATSTGSSDPRAGLLAAIDGNPNTGWIATLRDLRPTVTLGFAEPRTVGSLVMYTDPTLAASAPKRALVTTDAGKSFRVRFDADGRASFRKVKASRLSVKVESAYVRSNLSFDGTGSGLPLGISELGAGESGAALAADVDKVVSLPCGTGPTVAIDGELHQTSIRTSRSAVLSGRAISSTVCGLVASSLDSGEHRIRVAASSAFRPTIVRLSHSGQSFVAGTSVPTSRSGSESIDVDNLPGAGNRLTTLNQNFNSGWSAKSATAVTVNGWQQGWTSTSNTVEARFGVGWIYQVMLWGGLLAALALLIAAWRLRHGSPNIDVRRVARRRTRAAIGAVVAIGTTVLVGGVGGSLLAGAAVGVVLVWGRRRDMSWLTPLGVLVAGFAYAMRPWTGPDGWAGALAWPQWCVVASLAATAAVVFDRELRTFLRRIAGSSITR